MNDDSPTAASLLPLPAHRRRCAAASAAQRAAAAFTAATDAFADLPPVDTAAAAAPAPFHTHTHTAALALALARKASLYLFSGPRRLQHSPDTNFSPLPRDAALRRLNVRALSPVTLLSFQTPHSCA